MTIQSVKSKETETIVSPGRVVEKPPLKHNTDVVLPTDRTTEIVAEYQTSFFGIFAGLVIELIVTATLFCCAVYWCRINTIWFRGSSLVTAIICGVILYFAWKSTKAMGRIALRLLGSVNVD